MFYIIYILYMIHILHITYTSYTLFYIFTYLYILYIRKCSIYYVICLLRYASWMPKDEASSVWYQEKAFSKYEKSATLISNSQGFVKPINSVIQKAWGMFASHAYVHQYEKYGLTDDDFIDSFGCLEQIVSDYQHL